MSLRYSVEVYKQVDLKWKFVAARLTLEGAQLELFVQRRTNPSHAFRIFDRLNQKDCSN